MELPILLVLFSMVAMKTVDFFCKRKCRKSVFVPKPFPLCVAVPFALFTLTFGLLLGDVKIN